MITALSAAEPKKVAAMKGIDGTSMAGRGHLLSANRGVIFTAYGNEFALAHWLGQVTPRQANVTMQHSTFDRI